MMTPKPLVTVTCVAIIMAAIGWWAGARTRTPEQVAAQAGPPPTSVISTQVERRELRREVLLRVDAHSRSLISIEPDLSGLEHARPVVTLQSLKQGDVVNEGDVVAEVALRPIFALQGDIPMFRTLSRGATGRDVRQLQEALHRLGHYHGSVDGEFGPMTEDALRELYAVKGYEPPGPAEDALAALKNARESLEALLAGQQGVGGEGSAEKGGGGGEGGGAAMPDSGRALENARAKVLELEAGVGPRAAGGELAFVPALPAVVSTVDTPEGDLLEGPLLSVADPQVVFTGDVRPDQRRALKVGASAAIRDDLSGEQYHGEIAAISAQPEDTPAGPRFEVEIALASSGGHELAGRNLPAILSVGSSEGRVLAVPSSAVFAQADGKSYVRVLDEEGNEPVQVEVGMEAEGYVEVEPVGGSLMEGDQVVVAGDARETNDD